MGMMIGLQSWKVHCRVYISWCQSLAPRCCSVEVHPRDPFMCNGHFHPSSGLSESKWQSWESPADVCYVKKRPLGCWPFKASKLQRTDELSCTASRFRKGFNVDIQGCLWCPLIINYVKYDSGGLKGSVPSIVSQCVGWDWVVLQTWSVIKKERIYCFNSISSSLPRKSLSLYYSFIHWSQLLNLLSGQTFVFISMPL